MHSKPTLYAARGGGSAIIEALFALVDLDYEVHYCTWENLPDERLLAVNPQGEIPVLRLENGDILTESAAIALWLGDRFPDSGLVPPANHPRRPLFLRRLIWLAASVYPTFTFGDHPQRFIDGEDGARQLRDATEERRKQLWRQLERELESTWICGAEMTAVDIFVAVMSCWRPRREWFTRECPKLSTVALRVGRLDALRHVWHNNKLPGT